MPRPYFQDKNKKIQEIIMVDNAGEYGAGRIYQGQIAYAKTAQEKQLIQVMLNQEQEHLDYFETEIKSGKARPTVLLPLWHVLGYVLGALSSKLGAKTAMLVTESVEQVIVEHYQEQIDYLEATDNKTPLLAKIKQFKADEAEHIHIALEHDSKNARFYGIISLIVKTCCRSAIFLSKKV